jgi:hypothetical protein
MTVIGEVLTQNFKIHEISIQQSEAEINTQNGLYFVIC